MNNLGLWMIWTIFGHELKALDTINNSGLWMNKQLRVMCLRPGRYEHFIIVDDMNDSKSHDLKPLNAMNNLGLRMIWMILGHEPMTLNVMKR